MKDILANQTMAHRQQTKMYINQSIVFFFFQKQTNNIQMSLLFCLYYEDQSEEPSSVFCSCFESYEGTQDSRKCLAQLST